MFGLSQQNIEALRNVISCTKSVREAVVYGSRARGDNTPFSDIDIALKGDNITSRDLTRIYFMIEDLFIPYTVDLCVVSDIRNERLVQNIQNEGKVLYSVKSDNA